MEIINNILSIPTATLSTVTQGLSSATNTVNNYVVQPAFNGLCSGATLAKDGINAVVVKPVVVVAQGIVSVAKMPYVSATVGVAGAGLIAKGFYDLSNNEVSDKSVAKKLVAGGSLALLYTTTCFAVSYFAKEASKFINEEEIPNSYFTATHVGTAFLTIPMFFLCRKCCNLPMRIE